MKQYITTIILAMLSIICMQAQPFNTEIKPEGKDAYLLGKVNKKGLSKCNDNDWFKANFKEYETDNSIIDQLDEDLSEYTITAFMGTWCGDSKREIPRFYKVLEEANFPLERLTMIAVSRDKETYKQSPGGEEEGLNIHRVPTFIFYKDGKEVNRIVESPVESLEKDLQKIIQGNYRSKFEAVEIVDTFLDENGWKKLQKKSKRLASQLNGKAENMYELNTYSHVLFYSDKKNEAVTVARLNTLLFPLEQKTYENLAHKLAKNGQQDEAIKSYEIALSMDTENEKILSWINQLKNSSH